VATAGQATRSDYGRGLSGIVECKHGRIFSEKYWRRD